MKAEHRKELHTNALAKWLADTVEDLRTSNRAWTRGLTIVLVVAALVGVYVYFLGSSTSSVWSKLNTAEDLRQLEKIARENPGTKAGQAAQFEIARRLYHDGIQDLANRDMRASALAKLDQARKLYLKLSESCKDAPLMAQEALMWTAQSEEALSGAVNPDQPGEPMGSLDKAIGYYQQVAQSTPETFHTKAAAERAKHLTDKKADIEAFYSKLNATAGSFKR